ncbi:hypothetical protein OROGR_020503 [Orobanche gracilis]
MFLFDPGGGFMKEGEGYAACINIAIVGVLIFTVAELWDMGQQPIVIYFTLASLISSEILW